MTVEFVLLMVVVFSVGLKFLAKAPMDAFSKSAPRLGALVEKNIATGTGFKDAKGNTLMWEPPN
ncbi:MAG: hypothetical protein IPK04_19115 [Bdellovibrionales bacterium]|jgi:hypothetical protein|nr:hypothetical protein [Bdellovibrionales bacterium]MBL7669132.1 hypothetical protein [Pseudobdellovibrionaceae bacterium]